MSNRSSSRAALTALRHALLAALCAAMLFPAAYALATSFKTKGDALTFPPRFLPARPTLEAYATVLGSDMLRRYIPNTIVNSLLSSAATTALAAAAAYGFSRYRFRGSGSLLAAILGLMMIPGLTNLVALYRLGSGLGILGSRAFIVAVYTAGGLPFSVWILKAFFDAIPKELEEAALTDGCSPARVLLRVTAPLAAPGIFAAFLFMIVDTWNEFLAAVILIPKASMRTATVGLYEFQSSFESAYHVLSAACIVIMLPVVVLFLATRRRFMAAMLEGGLKG